REGGAPPPAGERHRARRSVITRATSSPALQRHARTGVSSAEMPVRPTLSPTLKTVSDAVLAVAAELSVEEVLQRLVHSARELAGARYAALGLPGGEGGFR